MKVALAAAFAFAAACGAGSYAYLDGHAPVAAAPIHLAPPSMMGLLAGTTQLADVTAAAARHGLVCEDASMTAIMMRAHATQRAAGGAKSATPPSDHWAMLSDPRFWQVRLSCENADGSVVHGDPATKGRLLVVLPANDKPVQLMTYERHHVDRAAATADLTSTLERLERLYGAPALAKGERGEHGELALLSPVDREWRVGGAVLHVRAIDFGARGTAISEEIRTP